MRSAKDIAKERVAEERRSGRLGDVSKDPGAVAELRRALESAKR